MCQFLINIAFRKGGFARRRGLRLLRLILRIVRGLMSWTSRWSFCSLHARLHCDRRLLGLVRCYMIVIRFRLSFLNDGRFRTWRTSIRTRTFGICMLITILVCLLLLHTTKDVAGVLVSFQSCWKKDTYVAHLLLVLLLFLLGRWGIRLRSRAIAFLTNFLSKSLIR